MFTTRALGIAGTAAAFLAITPALAASAVGDHELDDHGRDGPVLEGRAVLPAETYAPGPPSGAVFAGQTINGVTFPNPSQPAIGYSGIVAGRSPGEYLAMPDNGFGNKANSFDFELRAYYITPTSRPPTAARARWRSASTTTSPSVTRTTRRASRSSTRTPPIVC